MSASKVASKSQNFLVAPSSTYALTIQWLYYIYILTYQSSDGSTNIAFYAVIEPKLWIEQKHCLKCTCQLYDREIYVYNKSHSYVIKKTFSHADSIITKI